MWADWEFVHRLEPRDEIFHYREWSSKQHRYCIAILLISCFTNPLIFALGEKDLRLLHKHAHVC